MDMEKINENPVRVLLTQTEKKGLFSKKEVPVYAIGDENGTPLTEYEFSSIKPFEDGFAVALKKKGGRILLDTNGKEVLPNYRNYNICVKNGFLTLYKPSTTSSEDSILNAIWQDPASEIRNNTMPYWARGLANKNQEILIDPQKNTFLQIFGDIVLYGEWSVVSPDYSKLGVGKLSGDQLVSVLPCVYNHVEYLWDRILAVGRFHVTKTRTPSSLTKDTITVTSRLAVQLYNIDKGWVSDLIFGNIFRTDGGNFSAVIYPHIRPEDLTHQQSVGEAFSGAGLLDLRDPKEVLLNDRFEILR